LAKERLDVLRTEGRKRETRFGRRRLDEKRETSDEKRETTEDGRQVDK
jgi:hypothetical protein